MISIAVRWTTALGLLAATLAGCSTPPTPPARSGVPSVYQSQTKPGATLDKAAAASMATEFRRGAGRGPVTLDPALNRMAEEQAAAMARSNKLSHSVAGSFKERIARSGYRNGGMWENVGAGHDTLADAFTGWRSSPSHMKNMLEPKAQRIGIAAVAAPGTRYEVFWAMVLADPADPRPAGMAGVSSPATGVDGTIVMVNGTVLSGR
jgi:uncharacterized protein YkwD